MTRTFVTGLVSAAEPRGAFLRLTIDTDQNGVEVWDAFCAYVVPIDELLARRVEIDRVHLRPIGGAWVNAQRVPSHLDGRRGQVHGEEATR